MFLYIPLTANSVQNAFKWHKLFWCDPLPAVCQAVFDFNYRFVPFTPKCLMKRSARDFARTLRLPWRKPSSSSRNAWSVHIMFLFQLNAAAYLHLQPNYKNSDISPLNHRMFFEVYKQSLFSGNLRVCGCDTNRFYRREFRHSGRLLYKLSDFKLIELFF